MDDVASVKSENANLRRIQNKLLEWDIQDCPLAPLTPSQRDFIYELSQISADQSLKEDSTAGQVTQDGNTRIETTQEFLNYFAEVEEELVKGDDLRFIKYYEKLAERDVECDILLGQINASLSCLSQLVAEHTLVSTKTSALHLASEQLLADQNSLHDIGEEVRHRLHYFTQVEHLNQRLSSPTLSVSSDMFIDILNKIDECMEYIKEHSTFKESPGFLVKYRHCLARAIALVRTYVTQTLIHATEQMLAPRSSIDSIAAGTTPASADTFALFYGKFQACAPKVKKIIQEVENRMEKSDEYINLITECQQCFLSQRVQVMSGGVSAGVQHISTAHKGDHCSLVRSGCAFLIHVCEDEHRLFYQFFSKPSIQLTSYLEGLCTTLYDNLRPFIIHVNHLETLAELCSILRVEMLDDHVQNSPESLEAFSRIAWQLLQDIQERLVFRAHLYLQSDILNYKPAPGDLAYPEKLEMMESIAQSLQEQPLRRSDSRSSLVSVGSTTSQEVAKINADTHLEQPRSRTGNSPADLHGMWYPPVRRTLVCLSRLYRCVERPIFQGLSQEALSLCIQSIANASHQITANKTAIDGELFQIKHLLILREQIAPFQVDFTVKEMSLDFSKVKTAAFSLLHKRKHLFSLGTNNALLEFLLEGTPQVKEQLLDSRKDVDRQLKSSCETFIKYSTSLLAGPVINFNEKAQTIIRVASETQKPVTLRAQPWASPAQVGGLIQESQRYIKTRLAGIQRSMQLYLANKDTEFILFRPIRNNIVAAYVKLEQLLTSGGYSADDLIIASCPTPEQVSVIISSASLLAEGTHQVAHSAGPSRKTSVQSVSFASANSLRHQTLSEETKEPTQNVFTV